MCQRKRRRKGQNLPEIPDTDRTEVQSFYHPLILGVTIPVLVRPQGMSDTLDRVNNRAGEIICRINLPFFTTACRELVRWERERRDTHPVR